MTQTWHLQYSILPPLPHPQRCLQTDLIRSPPLPVPYRQLSHCKRTLLGILFDEVDELPDRGVVRSISENQMRGLILRLPSRSASGYFWSLTSCRNSQFLFLGPRMSSVGSASIAFIIQIKYTIRLKHQADDQLTLRSAFPFSFSISMISTIPMISMMHISQQDCWQYFYKMNKLNLLADSPRMEPFKGSTKNPSIFSSFKKTPPKNVFQKTPPKTKPRNMPSNSISNNTSQKTPPKYPPLMGVSFSARHQSKTSVVFSPLLQNRRSKVYRNLTLQMYELGQSSDVQNIQNGDLTPRSIVEDEYFYLSLDKIAKIRSKNNVRSISMELNEVLNMIKEEKLKISEKMKILRKTNKYYRGLCEGTTSPTKETGTNPNDIIDNGLELEQVHQETQIEPEEVRQMDLCRQESRDHERRQKQNETYVKLYAMLEAMGIDYHQILPELPVEMATSQQKRYKSLSESEVIKIQQFFIQKLSSKLSP